MQQLEGTLTVSVERLGADRARLRYDYGPGRAPGTAAVALSAIEDMLRRAETEYYAALPAKPDEARTLLESYGTRLFAFLDTPERRLSAYLDETRGSWDVLVLALHTGAGFAHLPWELLHDGRGFLVAQDNPVVPVRKVAGEAPARAAQSRPLRMVFMACAPESAGGTLDYDIEEARIWEGTRRFQVDLEVEDSGELTELRHRVLAHPRGEVDVVHLTGHAVLNEEGPRFLAEGPHGEEMAATAGDIQHALGRCPSLVFLSGCRTAESPEAGAVASLAESLAGAAVPLVLGWGRPVPDATATDAAAVFYQQLAEGLSPAVALAGTYRHLVRHSVRYWHLLRMFVRGALPGPLVTPLRASGRDRVVRRTSPEPPTGEPLDRRSFVGRRREIQRARRLLEFWDGEQSPVGLIVHGAGGVGKTALARRLFQRLVNGDVHGLWLHGDLDRDALLNEIGGDPRLAPALGDVPQDRPLRDVLHSFLHRAPNLLIVLDEFEFNFRPDRLTVDDIQLVDGRPVTRPESAAALTDLVEAVRRSQTLHRIVITSRYLPVVDCVRHLEKLELQPPRPFELDRLVERLQGESNRLEPSVVTWARQVAGDNPWLLKRLFAMARSHLLRGGHADGGVQIDEHALLAHFRDARGEFLEKKVLAPMLLGRIDPEAHALLTAAAPFLTPVPAATLARLTGTEPAEAEAHAVELAGLALLESTRPKPDIDRREGGEVRFRVPLVLNPLFTLTDPVRQRRRVSRCARSLVRLLGDDFLETPDPRLLDHEILQEVHRLALEGGELELAVDTAVSLADVEFACRRYAKAAALCLAMLKRSREHRLFLRLAGAENELGHAADADLYIQRALELCPADNRRDRAAILAQSAHTASRRDSDRCLAHAREAVALSRLHGRRQTLAFSLCTLAAYYVNHGSQADRATIPALFDEAMATAEKVRDRGITVAGVRFNRAVVQYLGENALDTARAEFSAVIDTYERLDLPLHQAIALLELSSRWLDQEPPDPGEAERLVHQAIKLNQRLRSAHVEASIEFCLGAVALVRQEAEAAGEHYTRARNLCRDIGDELLELQCLVRLLTLYRAVGDVERAVRCGTDALGLTARLPGYRTEVLLSSAEQDQQAPEHDTTAVLERSREAASLAREIGDTRNETRAWDLFATEAAAAPDPSPELIPVLERLLELSRTPPGPGKSADPGEVAGRLRALGEQLLRVERFQEARPPLLEALELAAAASDHSAQAQLHELLASAAGGTQDDDAAEEHLRLGVCHWLTADAPHAAALALRQLAAAQWPRQGAQARWSLRAARSLARVVPSGTTESQILTNLAALEQADGATTEAVALLENAAHRAHQRGTPLRVLISEDLVEHFDPDRGSTLLSRVEELRAELRTTDDWVLPPVNFQDTIHLEGACTFGVWGEVVHRTPLVATGDPVAQLLTDLKAVVRRHREAIDAGEPAPPPEPGIEDIPVADIRAALRCPPAQALDRAGPGEGDR